VGKNCLVTRRGFTLIELMIVIAIIGILVGLLLPALNAIREKAQRVQVVNLVREASLSCEAFRLENNQYPWTKPTAVKADTEIKGEDVYSELRAGAEALVNTTQDYLGEVPRKYIRQEDVSGKPRDRLKDIWDQDLKFRVNPNTLAPVVWSRGRNKVDDTNFENYFDITAHPEWKHTEWYSEAKYGTPYTPPDPPDNFTDAAKYPRAYLYLGDGVKRRDDLTKL